MNELIISDAKNPTELTKFLLGKTVKIRTLENDKVHEGQIVSVGLEKRFDVGRAAWFRLAYDENLSKVFILKDINIEILDLNQSE